MIKKRAMLILILVFLVTVAGLSCGNFTDNSSQPPINAKIIRFIKVPPETATFTISLTAKTPADNVTMYRVSVKTKNSLGAEIVTKASVGTVNITVRSIDIGRMYDDLEKNYNSTSSAYQAYHQTHLKGTFGGPWGESTTVIDSKETELLTQSNKWLSLLQGKPFAVSASGNDLDDFCRKYVEITVTLNNQENITPTPKSNTEQATPKPKTSNNPVEVSKQNTQTAAPSFSTALGAIRVGTPGQYEWKVVVSITTSSYPVITPHDARITVIDVKTGKQLNGAVSFNSGVDYSKAQNVHWDIGSSQTQVPCVVWQPYWSSDSPNKEYFELVSLKNKELKAAQDKSEKDFLAGKPYVKIDPKKYEVTGDEVMDLFNKYKPIKIIVAPVVNQP